MNWFQCSPGASGDAWYLIISSLGVNTGVMNSLVQFWYCILDCMLPYCCPKVILQSRPRYENLLFKHFTKKVFLIESVNFLSSELIQFSCFHRHVFNLNHPRKSITVNSELMFAYLAANWQLAHSRIYLI